MLFSNSQEIASRVFTEKFLHICAGSLLLLITYYFLGETIKNEIVLLNKPEFTYSALVVLLLSFTFFAYAVGSLYGFLYKEWVSTEDYRKFSKIVFKLNDIELSTIHILTYKLEGYDSLTIEKDSMYRDYKNILIYDLVQINPHQSYDKLTLNLKRIDFFLKNEPEFVEKIMVPLWDKAALNIIKKLT